MVNIDLLYIHSWCLGLLLLIISLFIIVISHISQGEDSAKDGKNIKRVIAAIFRGAAYVIFIFSTIVYLVFHLNASQAATLKSETIIDSTEYEIKKYEAYANGVFIAYYPDVANEQINGIFVPDCVIVETGSESFLEVQEVVIINKTTWKKFYSEWEKGKTEKYILHIKSS